MAVMTLAEARDRVQDVYTGEILDYFRRDRLMDIQLYDDNVQRSGKSMFSTFNVVTQLAVAAFRKIGEEFVASSTKTEKRSVELAIMGVTQEMDRVHIENMINSDTGLSDLDFQLKEDADATKMLFSDAFINGNKAANTGEFDGLDKIASGGVNDFTDTTDGTNLASGAEDSEFLGKLDKALLSLKGGVGQKYIALDEAAVMPSILRILRNSSQILQTLDAWGQPVYRYGGAEIIVTGQAPDGSEVIPTVAATGETAVYAFKIGPKAIKVLTAFPEIIRLRVPNFQFMNLAKQTVGVEAVLAPAVYDNLAVAKIGKVKVK